MQKFDFRIKFRKSWLYRWYLSENSDVTQYTSALKLIVLVALFFLGGLHLNVIKVKSYQATMKLIHFYMNINNVILRLAALDKTATKFVAQTGQQYRMFSWKLQENAFYTIAFLLV